MVEVRGVRRHGVLSFEFEPGRSSLEVGSLRLKIEQPSFALEVSSLEVEKLSFRLGVLSLKVERLRFESRVPSLEVEKLSFALGMSSFEIEKLGFAVGRLSECHLLAFIFCLSFSIF
ncbi:MAG: hypothetical protein KME45_08825 [Stenomitos rutilans HA7619-LM2]|jgi:hypothetical protein|nr:hypothetical protein [Stenomitos rutilans HA7619-LM2]